MFGWIGFSIPQVDKYELGTDFRGITIKSTNAFSNAIDGENNVVVKEADEKRAVVEAPGGYNFIIENEDVAKGDPVQRVSVGVSRDGVEGFLVQYYRATHLLANLGWVDFDLRCSTILPSCPASSAKFPPAQAEWAGQLGIRRNIQIKANRPPASSILHGFCQK